VVAVKGKKSSEGIKISSEPWAFEVQLPYPPSLNKIYATSKKTGRRFLTKEGKAYKAYVVYLLKEVKAPRFDEILHVDCYFVPPDNRIRDEDNLHKLWQDAFTDYGVWSDDSKSKSKYSLMCPADKDNTQLSVRVIGRINE